MTSHLNSHRTTDIKPEMLSGVQTGNGTPHDKYNIRGNAQARTNRKDDIFMQRRLGVKGLVYWRSTQCAGHIPSFFSLYAAHSVLRHFFLMAQTYVIPTLVMVLGKISQSDVSFDNFAHCTERRTYHNDDIFLSLIFNFSYLLARGTRINPTFVFVQYNISLLVVYLLAVGCGRI